MNQNPNDREFSYRFFEFDDYQNERIERECETEGRIECEIINIEVVNEIKQYSTESV